MNEKPETTREILRDIQRQQSRITYILLGDEKAKQDGLVHKVDKHGKYISKDKRFKWAVAALLFGGTGGFLTWVKTHLGI